MSQQPGRGSRLPLPRHAPGPQVGAVPVPVPRPRFPGDKAVPSQEGTHPAPSAGPPPARTAAPVPPVVPPQGPGDTCLDQLSAGGVTFEVATVGPQPNALCTVAAPVRMTGLKADGIIIGLPDRPVVACATGVVFSDFVRALLSPLARGSYGSPVATVSTGPGFECRARDHIPGAKISAHAQGLAIDIAQLTLTDGRKIEVGSAKTETDRMFDRAARAGACGFFHTALGPGADAFHETHWHFDLLPRGTKGDAKICE